MTALAALAVIVGSVLAEGVGGSVRALRASRPPVVDGVLSPGEWDGAPAFGAWIQQLPAEGAPPTERTKLCFLYDDRALYFAFRLHERSGEEIVARLTRRDRDVGSDAVQLDLDSRGDGQGAFHFEVSAAGVQRDAIRTGDQALNFDW